MAQTATRAEHGIDAPFEERLRAALADPRLESTLSNFQNAWRESRVAMMDEVDFAALRGTLKAAKTEAIDNIDQYLDQFAAAAERVGTHVHFAATADDATQIIERIAREHDINLIAKSKSMVSEEIALNHTLADHGIEVVETDLGEWIVQLRHERPSHMVMPAIHLARQQTAAVISDKVGYSVSADDVSEQVHVARDEIRSVFFIAGMGITGANALVAESGSVMMCTNEGNGRLGSSLPPVHVVLAGIEKLVPTFDDAMTNLRLLARSATAQRMTVYSTFITGPTPGHEMHIVLVDNGRRVMRALPEFREALHCIRCAACANVCPPYREVGGHVFGYIYSGAIGLVVTPFLNGLEHGAGPQSLCLSCNACETVCPVGIPLARQILDVRKMVVANDGLKPAKRVILRTYASRRIAQALMKIGERAQLPLTHGGRFVRGTRIPMLNKQTRWRSLPALARPPLRDRVARLKEPAMPAALVPNAAAGKTIALFPGCMTDWLYPEQGEAIATVMRALGVGVVHPEGLHCCGLPANNSGDTVDARSMAKQTLGVLERIRADYIVSGSASCVAMIAQDYLHLFRDDPRWLARAEKVAGKTIDFTSFLVDIAKLPAGALAIDGQPTTRITYHDTCQGLNALGLHDEPRYLLHDVLGCEIQELAENRLCCGFGGSFSFEYPQVAKRLMDRKLDNAAATGAPVVVTDNQGCIMHLRGGADAREQRIKVRHLAELMAERIEEMRVNKRASGADVATTRG